MTFESCAPVHRFVLLARNVKNSIRNWAAANSVIRGGELNTNILIEARSAALAHMHTHAYTVESLQNEQYTEHFGKDFEMCVTAILLHVDGIANRAYERSCICVPMWVCVRVCDTECVFIEWVSVLPILRIGDEIYRTSIHRTHRIHTILPNRIHPSHGMCVPIVQYTNIHQIVCVYLYNRSSSSSSSSDVYTRTHAHIAKNLLWWIFSSVVDEHFFFWSNIRCNINSETHRKNEKKNERKKCFFSFVVGKIRLKLLANIK